MARTTGAGNRNDHLVQYQIVVLALYFLEGHSKRVDTEDVAIKAHQLAPGRFAWAKYPEQVNLELVRVALSDAKKPDKGRLIVGSGKTGWSLSPAGLAWAKVAAVAYSEPVPLAPGQTHGSKSPHVIRRDNERTRVLSSGAWAEWCAGTRPPTLREVRTLLRIDSYTTAREISEKSSRLLAMFSDDPELREFVEAVVATAVKEDE
jgi:hypothetical protein